MILVLDLDGVIVRGHPEGGRWDKDLARDLGIDPARVQTRFFAEHFKDIVIGRKALIPALESVWSEMACETSPQAFVDYWFAKDSKIDRDVIALVNGWRASGRKAFIATLQEHERARHVWETLGLSQHFDGLFYSAALGAAKPDPEFFHLVQQQLPVSGPAEILFLDDRAENVAAAAALGWQARIYREADDLRSALDSQPPSRGG